MKFWKILLGVYQVIVVASSVLFILVGILSFASSSAQIHWSNVFLVLLLAVPTIVFCSFNAVKLLMPARKLFEKWKSLTQTSMVFTVLWTLLFAYLLIFQTGSGSCQTSVSATGSLQIGQMSPDFSIKDQLGNTISLSKLKGEIVLLDFWGVWCGPCRKKLPHTQRIYDKFKDKGLAVIGIHSAFRTEKTADFIAENNYTFPTGIDPGHIAKDYAVTGWPTYYLIDKEGQLVWGPKHSPPSEKQVESLLKD